LLNESVYARQTFSQRTELIFLWNGLKNIHPDPPRSIPALSPSPHNTLLWGF
jgi:hypothetical protein